LAIADQCSAGIASTCTIKVSKGASCAKRAILAFKAVGDGAAQTAYHTRADVVAQVGETAETASLITSGAAH
jgi:hypothetical protein